MYFPPTRSIPQTESEYIYFVQLKFGRGYEYPTGVEEWTKCGRKSRAYNVCPTMQKSSTNWNVEDHFIPE